jgi:hypothetical protein
MDFLKPQETKRAQAHLHCPICTHTVPGEVEITGKKTRVVRNQKCKRCGSSLDAAAVLYLALAA